MNTAISPLEVAALGVALALILLGLGLMARASFVLLAAQADPYQRLLAVVTAQGRAVGLIGAGLGLAFQSWGAFVGLLLLAAGFALAGPALAHACANAAHADGVEPNLTSRKPSDDR